MARRVFCNVENTACPAEEFSPGPNGTTIHRLTAKTGHTLDGWRATFVAEEEASGEWVLTKLRIIEPALPQFDLMPARES